MSLDKDARVRDPEEGVDEARLKKASTSIEEDEKQLGKLAAAISATESSED